jgi:tetratricopeptide (TPR) repeat protein
VLLDTAMLTRLTAPLAAQVSEVSNAGDELRELYEANCFVDRRLEDEPTYELHALFREFLLDRVRREFSRDDQQRLARRCAAALKSAGRPREAAELYVQAGDWPGAIMLILEIAPRLLAQGRWLTLQQMVSQLPREQLDAMPWLRYWSGAAAFATDLGAAREHFSAAFERFREGSDALGQMLAAAGIIETYCAADDDLGPAKPWMVLLDEIVSTNPPFPSVELETQVLSILVLSTAIGAPENPHLDGYEHRLMPLIECDIDPNVRAPGAFALMNYNSWLGRSERVERAAQIGRQLVANPALLPIRKVYVYVGLAYHAYTTADYEESNRQFAAAFSMTEANGLSMLDPFLHLCETWHHLARGEYRAMAPVARRAAAAIDHRRRADVSLVHHVNAWLALLEGDLGRSKQEAETALALGIAIGWKYVRPLNLFALAEVQIERGEYAEADQCLEQFRTEFSMLDGPMLEFDAGLTDAYCGLRQGNESRCAASLTTALAIGRTHGFMNNSRWYAPMMSRLAAFALEHGIEPEYTRSLIRRRELLPERPIERWPWPVRVYTLGRFPRRIRGQGATEAARTAEGIDRAGRQGRRRRQARRRAVAGSARGWRP